MRRSLEIRKLDLKNYTDETQNTIVEDNILLAGQQKKWFEKSGCEAVTTIDEPGARRLLKRSPFDLVLSDVRLPGDGISLLEWMQRERIDVPLPSS